MELLPFVDILKVFNNPINEEQAWAVCYQCAHFLFRNPQQEFYQVVLDSGIYSIWLSRHGDVFLRKGPSDPNGSGKGPPHHGPCSPQSSIAFKRKRHVISTETDAVLALGTAIFEALDYGIEASEERQLSPGLEALIVTMTSADTSMDADMDPEAQNVDDEGIEKDADLEPRCTVADVLQLCSQHLSSKQDAQHHYKAVCRALATEAGELFTFLDKISNGREKLSETADEDSRRLEELQTADWACLWVQVMRSLRQGVLLKKIEHVHHPPLEYELTPFEILLEDIRTRRYTLHKIMVNGEIPRQVKDDAQAVILDFIRSRPPLKRVDERKLKPKPQSPPDPHELLLKDIRARPRLRPVKDGKLVVETSRTCMNAEDESEAPLPVKRVIKPDFHLLLNNSFEESSEDEEHHSEIGSPSSQSSPSMTAAATPPISWHTAVARDTLMHESGTNRTTRLQRRHTIMVCESPLEGKVAQELPPLEEEEEPSPIKESHNLLNAQNSQNQALPAKTSFSHNDLLAQVVLRHPQGHGNRRYSLEHRRSLTSLTSGLCAIPELEDSPGGHDPAAPSKHVADPIQRARNQEQAPPPNPSPPCKGRALGMSMTGMKSLGGPYHPKSQWHPQPASSSSLTPVSGQQSSSMSQVSSGMKPVPASQPNFSSSQSSSSFSHRFLSRSQSQHAPGRSVSSSAPSSSSSSSFSPPLSSSLPDEKTGLDLVASSQSPVFNKATTHIANGSHHQGERTSATKNSNVERGVGRWRNPNARQERIKQRHSRVAEGVSGRVISSTQEESFDNFVPGTECEGVLNSSEESRSRRLSLDSGAPKYVGCNNPAVERAVAGVDTSNVSRRLSLGIQKNDGTGFRNVKKTPEEEERITRWRNLQEEDLNSRLKNKAVDNNLCVPSQKQSLSRENQDLSEENDNHHQQQQQRQSRKLCRRISSPTKLPSEETDVFHQKMADEESRFARWRRLEESGGLDSEADGYEDLEPDQEYVSSTLSARLQPSAHLNPACAAATIPNPISDWGQGSMSLAKRWQNPVECLSLTLEEVVHIRSVLTKAELESLISHPDLYQQVSKGKLCFTCKTTKFSLFGEWGTKCKFCRRTVCGKCLRKMNVPTDHFRNIPVYTLCPVPLTTDMQEFVQNFIKSTPASSVPPTRNASPHRGQLSSTSGGKPHQQPLSQPQTFPAPASKNLFNRTAKPLQRSQSALVSGQKSSTGAGGPSSWASIKGSAMAICCDCKGMVMEIIRASRASLAMLSGSGSMALASSSPLHSVVQPDASPQPLPQ